MKYYQEDDVLVFKLSQAPIDYAEEVNGVVIHFDKQNRPVRMEVLEATKFLEEEGRVLPSEVKQEYFAVA